MSVNGFICIVHGSPSSAVVVLVDNFDLSRRDNSFMINHHGFHNDDNFRGDIAFHEGDEMIRCVAEDFTFCKLYRSRTEVQDEYFELLSGYVLINTITGNTIESSIEF